MNDTDLIDELFAGIRERADRIDPPADLVHGIRRAARRRTAVRAAAAGVPALGGAGAAIALMLGGGSATHAGAAPGAAAAPAPVRAGGVPGQDIAYVVRRARRHLTQLAAGVGEVLERTSVIGNGTPGRPTVRNTDWAYVDPDTGIAHQRSVDRSAGGTELLADELVTTPVDGILHTVVTSLDPSTNTYFTTARAPGPAGRVSAATSATQLGIRSSAQQIARALREGQVTRVGSATIGGKATIELAVPVPAQSPRPAGSTITLAVDARTDAPVQEVDTAPNDPGDPSAGTATATLRWLPATAANIALTRLTLPAGATRRTGPTSGYWSRRAPLFFMGY
jgi:hypothetical protein